MNRDFEAKPNGETLMQRPTLDQLETVIAGSLPRHDAMALALLEIHERRLFWPGYKSFQDYLLRRWAISRARGYQLLHFARLKRMSTTVDTSSPDNERQARTLDAHGKARSRREENPIMRAMNYLANVFCRLPPTQRHDLIESIRALIADMEGELNQSRRPEPPT